MGTVHLGLKQGALGFRRFLAIKRLHPHLAADSDFVARFKDEIRLVSRLNHPNVVQTFDVLESAGELALVMEYVDGVTLHQLLRDASSVDTPLPVPVAVGIVAQALHGLHAAHELTDDEGRALQLVHRDFSPQNILIAREGLVKVLDFGVAKAASETHVTRSGQLSGKAPYMAPEQVLGTSIDRRTDVFAAGVVLWEALTSSRLFRPPGAVEDAAFRNVLEMRVQAPSQLRGEIDPTLDRLVLRALDRDPARRFGSARDFALALEDAVKDASLSVVANGVVSLSARRLVSQAPSSAVLPSMALERALVLPPRGSNEATGVNRIRDSAPTVPSNTRLDETSSEPTRVDTPAGVREEELQTSDVQGVPLDDSRPRRGPKRGYVIALAGMALLGALAWKTLFVSSAPDRGAASVRQLPGSVAGTAAPWPTHPQDVAGDPLAETKPVAQPFKEREGVRGAMGSSPALRAETAEPAAKVVDRGARKETGTGGSRSKRSRQPGAVTSRPNCSPPTYVDTDGIRHFKPECL
jgi:eukaryotic-like serine/threonine-protein kinase